MERLLVLVLVVAGAARAVQMLPVPPLALAAQWPAQPQHGGLFLGDIRAVLNVTATGPAMAQIFWRRRDNNPERKA